MTIESPRRLIALVLALGLAGGVSVLAQRGGGQGGQMQLPPITVNFQALSSDGTPVGDITAAEITLKVDGRDRTLESLRLVEFGASAGLPIPDAPGEAGTVPPPPPFGSNLVPDDVRNVMILFHDASVLAGQERGVKAALSQFIDGLAADTRIAFLTTPHSAVNVDFTTNHTAIQEGLAQAAGKALPNDTLLDFECSTFQVLSELDGIFTTMGNSATPTTIVFVSAGLAASTTEAARIGGGSVGRAGGEGAAGGDPGRGTECELRPDAYSELEPKASAARVQMYVLQPEGASSSLRGEEGLENLAGVTNGDKYLIGSSGGDILGRVARETSAYYVASFDVGMNERNNEAHRLEVETSRPGVTLRVPNTVFLGRAMGRGGPSGEAMSPGDMLRTTATFNDLPLKAVGVSSRIASGSEKLKIILLAEPEDRTVELNAAAAALISTDGRIVSQWTAQPEELGAYPFFTALTADPGEYRLRVAATDVDGRGGAVDYEMDVMLHEADTIFVSDLALMIGTETGPRPALEIRDEPEAMVYFELYGQPPADLLAVVDVAQRVDGEAIMRVDLNAAPSAEPDKFLINAILPVEPLPPGDYVVRVTIGRDPQTKLYQTIRKLPAGG
jgi:hypothetical protein